MPYPQAKQSLSPKGLVTRKAECPEHLAKGNKGKHLVVSRFIGPQEISGEVVWAFRCPEKDGHIFYAEPDPSAPKTIKGVEGWKKRQVS